MSDEWRDWLEKPPKTLLPSLERGDPPLGAATVWLYHRTHERLAEVAPFLARAAKERQPDASPERAVGAMLSPLHNLAFAEWLRTQPPARQADVTGTIDRYLEVVRTSILAQVRVKGEASVN